LHFRNVALLFLIGVISFPGCSSKQYGKINVHEAEINEIQLNLTHPQSDLVMLAVGKKDSVRKGMIFYVYRWAGKNPTYVGEVIVEKVLPDMSIARPIHEKMKAKIKKGDKVTIRLY